MIHIDSYFTNGNVKKTCQDYVIHGETPVPYVILCDGCSSSKFTDVGARILAHSAKNILRFCLLKEFNHSMATEEFYTTFASMTISCAFASVESLDIVKECLDTTLIVLYHDPYHKRPVYLMYGDGYVITMKQGQLKNVWWSTFEGNAPYYLSYLVDPERRKLYENFTLSYGNARKDNYVNADISMTPSWYSPVKHDKYNMYYIDPEFNDSIFIASDGIDSFVDVENAERLPFRYILKEFLAFKNVNGKYIERRVRRAMEDFSKVNIHNTDDVSFGGMIID